MRILPKIVSFPKLPTDPNPTIKNKMTYFCGTCLSLQCFSIPAVLVWEIGHDSSMIPGEL